MIDLHCHVLPGLDDGPATIDEALAQLELPFVTAPSLVERTLFAVGRGRPVLLAHVERCSAFHEDDELAGRLSDRGFLLQVTAGSLVGRFGRRVEQVARRLLEDGHAHVVSSDTHDSLRRPPGLREELRQAGLEIGERGDRCAEGLTEGPSGALRRVKGTGRSHP
ncbi:MAG: hypothetical protein MSC31_03520 [Solirubrobacteraceae bacterium MAG38_C4-C5]|nr:hypothetical protein [Candidatus Siliceabacter maunaloa]